MIITIDGAAGTGKSTVAKEIAKILDFDSFDTGAMYRAFSYFLLSKNISLDDDKSIKKWLKKFSFEIKEGRYFVNDEDVTLAIRTQTISKIVSIVSTKAFVRKRLLKIQRQFSKGRDAVFEGRDMGTVVFPKADLKFFLTATDAIKAERRYLELLNKFPDEKHNKEEILKNILERDHMDSHRKVSPLKPAKDAIIIDTSNLTIEEVIKTILAKLHKKKRFFYALVLFVTRFLYRLFYHFEVKGEENIIKGGAIIAANHFSFLDPPAVSITFYDEEIFFLARKSLFRGFFGHLISILNARPANHVKEMIHQIKKGEKILIFPEGTRSLKAFGPIRPGIELLVEKTHAPIIPVYIYGTDEIWGRDRKFPKLSGKIECIIGKPIEDVKDLLAAWESLRPR